MRNPWVAVLGIVLVAAGIIGVIVTVSARTPGSSDLLPGADGAGTSVGEQVYLYGIGEDGSSIPRSAVGPGMMGGGCVRCHGTDGTGGYVGMMGGFEAPDIRYSALTSPHEEHGEEAWTDDDIQRAITGGIEPSGEELDVVMPRWELTSSEFDALLDYLKELDDR